MAPDEIWMDTADPEPVRPPISRPEPAPFNLDDPRDVIRADVHRRFTGPRSGSWDYLESFVRDDTLVIRLRDDEEGLISVEVELESPVRPGDWDLLDVSIVELMDSGRPAPISVVDGVVTYRLDD